MYRAICLLITFNTCHFFSSACIITIPKTGTNLLIKCVKLITKNKHLNHISYLSKQSKPLSPENRIFWGHFCFGTIAPNKLAIQLQNEYDLKIILLKRDPRDLLCAIGRLTLTKLEDANLKEVIINPGCHLDKITPNRFHPTKYKSLSEIFNDYFKWQLLPNVYTATFENLVGPQGGGTREQQIQEILQIALFLKKDLDLSSAHCIADQLFGGTGTFRKGKAGGWKKHWTPELDNLFLSKENDLAQQMGYQ